MHTFAKLAYGNNAHNSLGNYQDALKYHHKHLEIALQLGDKGGEGMSIRKHWLAHETVLEIIKMH